MASPTRPDGVATMSMEQLSDVLHNAEEELSRLTEIPINDVVNKQLHCEAVKRAYDGFEILSRDYEGRLAASPDLRCRSRKARLRYMAKVNIIIRSCTIWCEDDDDDDQDADVPSDRISPTSRCSSVAPHTWNTTDAFPLDQRDDVGQCTQDAQVQPDPPYTANVKYEDIDGLSGLTSRHSNTAPENTHVSAGRPGQTTACMENYEYPVGREAENDVNTDLCRMASSCTSPPNTPNGTGNNPWTSSSGTSPDNLRSTRRPQVLHHSDNLITLPTFWDLHTRPPDDKPEQDQRFNSSTRCTWHHWRLLQETLTELALEIEDADPHDWDTHTHPFGTPRPPECGITRCQDITQN